ncbi:helix-turn-helix domain-containing protein [Aequorivita todarodis]|uniref:helix-turn-helix domain-containing protein n=1 Tax=Aequorivita todarodis TaxID=2036821 RepID=UPI002350EE57|nr:AraC family transcriptional regulator [Aequorivita todarodis]
MLVLFTCALTLLYKPFVLYGIDFDLTDKSDKQAKKEIENKFSLTEEQMLDYEERITSFFENERPFLKQNYKIKQLSEDIDIPAHHLSLFINEKYDLSYSNFVNRARIDHIVAVFGNEKSKQLTLEGLAKESGFNSRNTFIRAFKKYLGQTPSEYFQS